MSVAAARALAMVQVGLEKAIEHEVRVSIAVVDEAGFLVAFGRSDGARVYTTEVALGKAYAVVFMGRSSAEVRELAETRPQFFDAVKNLGLRTLIPSPGGISIPDGGAIGVSGAPNPDTDVEIATWAIEQTSDIDRTPGAATA